MPRKHQPDWDNLVARYAQPEFIALDPISFPHRYRLHPDWRNVECAAFLAALLSYGRREAILKTLAQVFDRLGESPVAVLLAMSPQAIQKQFAGFYYRFNTAQDICFVLTRLAEIYQNGGSLKNVWERVCKQEDTMQGRIHGFRKAFLTQGRVLPPNTYGMTFLFADPMQHSAAKRFNMFLRWMIRCDAVDLGLWQDVTDPCELMMPLDTHVAATVRKYQITKRKSNDWKTVEEITAYFRQLCPADPVRYDFALFGLGIAP